MKKFLTFLASLKLAVILLVLLLIGLSVGTIIESRSGVAAAGALVYYSWWFLALQGLFAINVALSIADLFPWGKKRIGFLLLHGSLLLIFAGSVVTYFFKIEGQLFLWEGESGNRIAEVVNGQVKAQHDLPFAVTLRDFVLDTYPGTMRPAGFMSIVQITDLDTNQIYDAKIWMNNELHHRGYALFQSSYQQEGRREATVLSVSKDPGQNIVFAGYILLVLGMIVVLFTRIGQVKERNALESRGSGAAKVAAALLLSLAAAQVRAATPAETLKRLPVQHDGRVMPLDTLAREAVWNVTGSYSWKGEDPVVTVVGWLSDPQAAANAPVVKIGSDALANAAGLPAGTTHVAFARVVQSQRVLQLMDEARQKEQQGIPRQGVVQDAEKLEQRLLRMQSILNREAVRPVPVPGNPKAKWSAAPVPSAEGLLMLMAGPRPAGWPAPDRLETEIRYNELNPVRWSWIILAASLLVSIVAGIRKSKLLDGAAFGLLLAGFAMMSWGIWLRWVAGDRIPAANMYESMLFLAWGVGFFAVIAYAVMRNRVVVLNAAVMAALTMALTDLLPIDRFIHPIAPVLAGTPWLAIHVPIIMVGYAVLALGLVVAHMQIGFTIFAPRKVDVIDRLYDLLYWYMFVGSILLIAGILTGSMWAASSWGRYWGWDPKEVWSLVAFLCYMAILHAKVDKQIGQFGVAAISIAAFQTILFTYLGVNFVLTTGMHSYGMGDSPVVMWMVITAVVELAFLAWGWVAFRKNRHILEASAA
ncbi:MAG TPA: cytochrome c biogenesis protein CcsA [Anaeromyxobacteraceae bacterium]|nr:cytochrome c biogenesis protein CcsA [Anaeromyxobacteraceae bacterium]